MVFLYLMKNVKPLNEQVIKEHVEFLKDLKHQKRLILCGPFSDYPGGIVILKASDMTEAITLVEQDPFIKYDYKTYELRTLEIANEDNNYLL